LSNVMDTKDMSDIGIINRLPEPKDPRTGRRRPHVPSSKTNNVKERLLPTSDKIRRTTSVPRCCYRGTCCPSLLATNPKPLTSVSRSASVKRPLSTTPDSVKCFIRISAKFAQIADFRAFSAPFPTQPTAIAGNAVAFHPTRYVSTALRARFTKLIHAAGARRAQL
jgi:hypothetical protein